MKNNIVIGVVIVALVLTGIVITKSVINSLSSGVSAIESLTIAVKSMIPFGASPGGEFQLRTFSHQGATDGGKIATTTQGTTYTVSSKDFRNTPTLWEINPNVQITITLNATATRAYVPNIGDVAKLFVRNASTTATDASITFAAEDSGLDLQYVEATGGDLVLDGLDYAEWTIIRESRNLTSILINEFTTAD